MSKRTQKRPNFTKKNFSKNSKFHPICMKFISKVKKNIKGQKALNPHTGYNTFRFQTTLDINDLSLAEIN
jgi:hypothetical protein